MRFCIFGVLTRVWFQDFWKISVSAVHSTWNRADLISAISAGFFSRKWLMRVGKENGRMVGSLGSGLVGFSRFCHSELISESRVSEFCCTFHELISILLSPKVPKASVVEKLVPSGFAHHFSCFISTQTVSPPELPWDCVSSFFLVFLFSLTDAFDGESVIILSRRFTTFRSVTSTSIIPSGISLIFACHSMMRVNISW